MLLPVLSCLQGLSIAPSLITGGFDAPGLVSRELLPIGIVLLRPLGVLFRPIVVWDNGLPFHLNTPSRYRFVFQRNLYLIPKIIPQPIPASSFLEKGVLLGLLSRDRGTFEIARISVEVWLCVARAVKRGEFARTWPSERSWRGFAEESCALVRLMG